VQSQNNQAMIRRNGKKAWNNIHVTVKQTVEDLIDIDNSNAQGLQNDKYGILNHTSSDINRLIQEAGEKGKRVRAIGSAWALTKIQVSDHWIINTKLLNACFEVDDDSFDDNYPQDKRKLLVIAQCGTSIAELNVYLERPARDSRMARSLKTAGIGAGQTVVGAVSGNTHGAAVNFGALPEFVVGIQLCNGTNNPLWIERSTHPVMNEAFVNKVGSTLVRDSDIFNSALVSFGAFGIVTAYAIETEPIYHIDFPKIREIPQNQLGTLLNDTAYYSKFQHLEFVFNPYTESVFLIEGTRVPYEEGHPFPDPLWIVTNKLGYAPGDRTPKLLLNLPFVSARKKSQILFKQYLKNAVLSDVRGSSGQLYTATITYLEGYNETAFAVSITDATKTIEAIKQALHEMSLPLVFQARIVHPGEATLGFTNHFPRAIVFEFGIVNSSKYPKFEEVLLNRLRGSGVRFTLHWSKNSLIDEARLEEMYGQAKINTWKRSRHTLFNNDPKLMTIFNNIHLTQAGLDSPPEIQV
jgi:hypothetical protein